MSAKKPNLIYDIGLHEGEDAEFYLEKGFEVIAFEADPILVEQCRSKFSVQIARGSLVIMEGAIVDPDSQGDRSTVKFYRNKTNNVWGTVFDEWAERNLTLGADSELIEVPVIDLNDCLHRYGVPYYMKIDIEGADIFCLRALLNSPIRPDYVSIESEKRHFRKLVAEFNLLERLGYSMFKAVEQSNVQAQRPPQPPLEGRYVGRPIPFGSSGLFGRELPGRWKTRGEIIRQYRGVFLLYKMFGDSGLLTHLKIGRWLGRRLARALRQPVPGWYDTHARHSDVSSRESEAGKLWRE